jgi:hypothetical protein
MQVGIELVSAGLGCGLAAVMSWVAIEGLFRLTFSEQGGAVGPLARRSESGFAHRPLPSGPWPQRRPRRARRAGKPVKLTPTSR